MISAIVWAAIVPQEFTSRAQCRPSMSDPRLQPLQSVTARSRLYCRQSPSSQSLPSPSRRTTPQGPRILRMWRRQLSLSCLLPSIHRRAAVMSHDARGIPTRGAPVIHPVTIAIVKSIKPEDMRGSGNIRHSHAGPLWSVIQNLIGNNKHSS